MSHLVSSLVSAPQVTTHVSTPSAITSHVNRSTTTPCVSTNASCAIDRVAASISASISPHANTSARSINTSLSQTRVCIVVCFVCIYSLQLTGKNI